MVILIPAGIAFLVMGAVIGYEAAILGCRRPPRRARHHWWSRTDREIRKLLS